MTKNLSISPMYYITHKLFPNKQKIEALQIIIFGVLHFSIY